jgi:hypothetical protein
MLYAGQVLWALLALLPAAFAARQPVTTAAPAFPRVDYSKIGLPGHPVQRAEGRWDGSQTRAKPTNDYWITLGIEDGGGQFTPFPYSMEQWPAGMRMCAPIMVTTEGAVNFNCQR